MTTTKAIPVEFGPDKSVLLRGLAIVCMIILHNDTIWLFKICVPLFTFLVGYGYAFARHRNLQHGLRRSWHLLSRFWLILLGIFLPVAIWQGGYQPTIGNVLTNMFGLDSNLNWYSWYIYFYLFAMVAMIPLSRVIDRWGIPAVVALVVMCYAAIAGIHLIAGWSDNIWLQALHDSILMSPTMFAGYYIASRGGGISDKD